MYKIAPKPLTHEGACNIITHCDGLLYLAKAPARYRRYRYMIKARTCLGSYMKTMIC